MELGLRYGLGDGVQRDYIQAYKWVELAARDGADGAQQARTFLQDLMTEQQVRAAKETADAFLRAGRNKALSSSNVGDG